MLFLNIELSFLSSVPLISCLFFSVTLFLIGMVGIICNKRNLMLMLICFELIFFAVALNFIFFSCFNYHFTGQILALLIVSVAAAETVIGLSLIILLSRLTQSLNFDFLVILRG